jgi:S1-C subfamily serine protease
VEEFPKFMKSAANRFATATIRVWVATIAFFGLALLAPAASPKPAPCQSIEDVGICDPYVPGTIILIPGNKPITVLGTWPHGPAEKAGICSGDQILAVNGVSTLNQSKAQLLREIVSSSPSPVRLEVRRNAETNELDVNRVRESTLAMLSGEKYGRAGGLLGFFGPLFEFPFNERPAEIQSFRLFLDRTFAEYGFKPLDGVYVPAATSPRRFDQVEAARQSGELSKPVGLGPNRDSYSAGFLALPLEEGLLVETVVPDSPAYHAGLLPGDRIVAIDGQATNGLSPKEISELLSKRDEAHGIALKIDRGGPLFAMSMGLRKTGDLEDSMPLRFIPAPSSPQPEDYILGIEAFRAEKSGEVMISQVQYPSPAFEAGLHVGDVLLAVNTSPVTRIDPRELSRLLTPSSAENVTLEISRLNKKISVTLTPGTFGAALASIGRKATKLGTAPRSCPSS